jgi:adenine-specific DNA-methyltransferase
VAAIDDLIAQIEDEALRDRLRTEVDRLTKEKKFGLVFEEHIPELTPIYRAPIREGIRVARREASLTEVWRVLSVENGQALCLNPATSNQRQMPVDDLVVVRRFGEPIFPALTPVDRVQNGPDDAPWHTLIEADNYHALQLLEYLYTGQVDCIYIDPPYNTGARDWKYNNDYVDANDRWRHSKWLAMMKRRLLLAKRLLNPRSSVLIITIDDNEIHHLGLLLSDLFPDSSPQLISIRITPSGTSGEGLSRVNEYAYFCFLGGAQPIPTFDDMMTEGLVDRAFSIRWEALMRGGNVWYRSSRPNLCYPIVLNREGTSIIDVGKPLLYHKSAKLDQAEEDNRPLTLDGLPLVWPVREDGRLGIWRVDANRLKQLAESGFAYVSSQDENRGTWTIRYLMSGTIMEIEAGLIEVTGVGDKGEALLRRTVNRQHIAKTMWVRNRHTAGGAGGTHLLANILNRRGGFPFPKSVYAVRDCLDVAIGDKKNALILDFFCGSGTTLNAVQLLNALDNGNRRCILVTNNEVSEDEAKNLAKLGYRPGDLEWERLGICRSITWPRCKYTITGRRADGTELEGEYLTGKTLSKEKARTFRQLGFIDPGTLSTAARKKEIVSLIEGIPMSHIETDTAFFVSEDERYTAAILFDDTQVGPFLDALEEMDHITHFYIVTRSNKLFRDLKAQITDLLGSIEVQEEEKRPMREGFPANLEYFKLDFLDKDQVALGRQFRAILPLLWLRAGAVGPRPELTEDDSIPPMLLPEKNSFAVLVDETRFADFQAALAARDDLTHIFLITDSEEAFQEMATQLTAPHVIQLYRDYLENFVINRGDVS